ncbi:MAG: TIGR00341 family protein [Gammaproteobacteria bacterium]|nr:TIGR00341 family protein [Gammaproteobacteria bacterium]
MTVKIIQVLADNAHVDTLRGIADQHKVADFWVGNAQEDGRSISRFLVTPRNRQSVLDAVQMVVSTSKNYRIFILPVEASIPHPETADEAALGKGSATTTREELYNNVYKGAQLDSAYLLLVFLSTIVAAIGLLENNVAVVIGAMVIAPLLGPNIALALGTAIGDTKLMTKALACTLAGLALTLTLSYLIGLIWIGPIDSHELMARTSVGFSGAALALASGAAAVLSLTTGLPSVLVGVMVAVALLPPAATIGIMAANQEYQLAYGAGLLLAVNIVCVNLSAKIVLFVRGVKPRTWLQKNKAKQSVTLYIIIWAISLLALMLLVYLPTQ